MSFADVVTSIQQIQAQLAQLSAAPPDRGSATAFADALTDASGTATAPQVSSTASTDGRTIASNGVTGDDVVQAALQYKGVPYVLGGESKSGMDCSGLVQKSFADLGISVPRLVHEQQTVGEKVDSLKDAKPGDLIVLNGGDHIAIYAGNDTVIHAPYEGRTVSVQKAWFTDKDIVTIRRIVPSSDAATAGAAAPSASSLSAAASTEQLDGLNALLGGSESASSLLGGDADGASSFSSLLSSLGASGSSSTAQQLLAARAALMEAPH